MKLNSKNNFKMHKTLNQTNHAPHITSNYPNSQKQWLHIIINGYVHRALSFPMDTSYFNSEIKTNSSSQCLLKYYR